MKKGSAVFSAILIPGLFIGLVYLSVEHFLLDREIRQLESRQERLIERNIRYIAQASALTSPSRIHGLAKDDLGMRTAQGGEIIYLEVRPANGAERD